MNREEYLSLMEFPVEWETMGMFPEQLAQIQISEYAPGQELGAEHNRNGAFHWWLAQSPSGEVLIKLIKLSYLDPDQAMAGDIRSYIRRSKNYTNDVARYMVG